MKSFITETGETAYVLTSSEKEIIQIALKQFQSSLEQGEVING